MNVQKAPRKFQPPTHFQKEFQYIHELCGQLKQLEESQRQEAIFKRNQDYNELKEMTEKSKQDDELALLGTEAAMGIINIGLRKQMLRTRLVSRVSDEKELNNMMQTHKDDFTQFIWKRRLQSRRDLRLLFQAGPGMIGRFGELISDSNMEVIQTFERNNLAKLCKEAITSGLCDHDDVPGFFNNKITLISPKKMKRINVFPSRLEFQIKEIEDDMAVRDPEQWYTVYATCGPWAIKLFSKPLVQDLVHQSIEQIRHISKDADSLSYIHVLARTIDLVHPTHQLQATILAFPLYGVQILKKRILSLGYSMDPANEDSVILDHKLALDILSQVYKKLETEHRYYFEWTTLPKTKWRIGFSTGRHVKVLNNTAYPGMDSFSFGFGNDGSIFMDGEKLRYVHDLAQSTLPIGIKTWGVMVDLHAGSINLVLNGNVAHVAFGHSASAFDSYEQERQKHLILTNQLIPTFSVQDEISIEERPFIRVNFGDKPFSFHVNALPMNNLIQPHSTKGIDLVSILEISGANANRERLSQEEDEKLHMSLEKNYFRVSHIPDAIKSFSQFPPSVYRRSLAATRLQRAWRRFKGHQMREKIKQEQYAAAVKIQRMARKKLRKIRQIKNESAEQIQKFWRKKMFIWAALLRCIYQQPIPELHRAATVIQRKWRHWHMFKNSPLASKYQTKIEDLHAAANRIIRWWRPLHSRMAEINETRRRNKAATNIQRVYRGFALRRLLRPDIRKKLTELGSVIAKARHSLLEIRSAYIIQRAWRKVLYKRVCAEKAKTRNKASTRIQSLWRGFWVRSHTPLRFTYGEAVFLTAVCKALRNSHFILKMYRPCGIVCPKSDHAFNRDYRK
ncbi:hypothetical protein BDV3_001679 [Batrachochytrium dendrobatidis]